MVGWAGGLVAGVAAFALVAVCAGCGAKRAGITSERSDRALTEEDLEGAGSLAQARAGVLGKEGAPSGPLGDIYFAYDSFDLDEVARGILQGNAQRLNASPAARLEIEGHCDERGTIEYNLALGAKRATSAKEYLVALGVERDRVTTISYGEELPLCREPAESCWRRNRRGHFVVLDN